MTVSTSAKGPKNVHKKAGIKRLRRLQKKEIVELFKKVQAQLRERVSLVKEEKKIEVPHRHVKENSAVDSLLNVLKRHSVQPVKKSSGGDRNSDQMQESNRYNGVQSPNSFDSNNSPKDESRDANVAAMARPRSVFQRKSPSPANGGAMLIVEDFQAGIEMQYQYKAERNLMKRKQKPDGRVLSGWTGTAETTFGSGISSNSSWVLLKECTVP